MPNRDDILYEETFKDQCEDVEHRIYYTLSQGKNEKLKTHRLQKLVILLVAHLQAKELLSDDELDEMLLDCIR